jgi:hypothetical protein
MEEKIFKVIAWAGLCFFAVCTGYIFWALWLVAHPVSTYPADNDMFPLMYLISAAGLIPMLVGGLDWRPRRFWPGCIITGTAYLVSLVIYALWSPLNQSHIQSGSYNIFTGILLLMLLSIPGLLSIGEGIWLKRKEDREYNTGSHEKPATQTSHD